MRFISVPRLSALFSITFAALALADKGSDLKPSSTVPPKPVFEDHFDAAQLAKPWVVSKGDWQIKDGLVVGKEKKSDNHRGVLFLALPNHNSAIRFSFKLDGANHFELSYNTAKAHLFRLILETTGLAIKRDRDKSDTTSKRGDLAKVDGKFEPGKWYTLLVEVNGAKVTAQSDNGVKAEAADPEIDVEKTGYRFVVAGESLALADVTVWK